MGDAYPVHRIAAIAGHIRGAYRRIVPSDPDRNIGWEWHCRRGLTHSRKLTIGIRKTQVLRDQKNSNVIYWKMLSFGRPRPKFREMTSVALTLDYGRCLHSGGNCW